MSHLDNSLVSTFNIVCNFGSILGITLFLKRVWFDRNRIVELLKASTITQFDEFIKKRLFIFGFTSLIALLSILIWFSYSHFILAENFYKSYTNTLDEVVFNIILRCIISHVTNFCAIVTRYQILVLICTMCKISWTSKKQLKGKCICKGTGIYNEMKSKLKIINDFVGNQMFAYYILVIGLYCQIPETAMGSRFKNVRFELVLCLFMDTVVWVFAAEFHHYTQSIFLEWIQNGCNTSRHPIEYGDKIQIINSKYRPCECCLMTDEINSIRSELVLASLKNELHFEPLAFNCRFFCVTYGLLTSVT